VLFASAIALGQSIPTATLSGRVRNDAIDLPGVTVTAKSPSLQGTRTTVTGASGDYVFANVPPGEYTITFAMQGFTSQTKTVTLKASQTDRVDVNLAMKVEAATTVTAQSDAVSSSSTQATTYTNDLLTKLPSARTVTAAATLSPGLTDNGLNGISIAGAQSTENLYTVNGVVITDNLRNSPTNLFIEDAIQETTTTTSSLSAEYGRFTGGVVNTITKSGGNTFSGSLRSTLTNDAWSATSAYRDPKTGANPQEGTFINKAVSTWEATFGGPILKDAVWFFGAGRYYDTSDAVSALTKYTNIPYTSGNKELRYEVKLTATPFQNHTFTADYNYTKIEQHNYAFPSYGVPDMASVYDRQQPTDLLALNYNGVLTSSFFVEGQYSKKKFTFENSGGSDTSLVGGSVIRDTALALAYNSPIFCAVCGPPETRNNDNFLVKGTYFLSTPTMGSHNIVGGYDDFGGQRMANNFQSGSNFVIYSQTASIFQGQNVYPVINSSTELDWWPVLQLSEGSNVRTRSAYLNDTWRLNDRLSFNLGVRWDKNDATNQAGQVTSKDSAFSPRLSAIYDVMGDGALRVSGSYAKYVAALQETQAGSAASLAGSPADFWWYYDGPGINTGSGPYLDPHAALTQLFDWFQKRGCLPDPLSPGCTVPLDGANIGGVNQQIRDSLTSPNTNEFALGFSGTLGSNFTYRTDFVRRQYRDYYDTLQDTTTGTVVNPINGAILDLSLVVNSNDYRREYTGLHTQVNYRIGQRLNLGANWTWSHLIGDIVGETNGSGPTRGGLHAYPEYFDRKWNSPVGDLAGDTRHRVRAYGTYVAPLPPKAGVLSVGLVQSWTTGTPYGAVGSVATKPYVTNPGYQTPPTSVSYYFTSRSAFRTEDIWRTDLSLYYSYRIADTVELFVTPQVYNVFNAQHVVTVNTAVETRVTNSSSYAAFNPFTTAPVQGPRGTGANWNYGPQFGQPTGPTSYQTPRYVTVSVGARF
jgi:outer membrane receptor for ferrienterochelin and colicin